MAGDPHDRRYREPEGRGGQDHHGHQPGGRSCPSGRQTLLVDLDPQANSTMSFLDMRQVTRTVYDVIAEPDARLEDVILPSTVANLSIAPARIALAKLEARLVGRSTRTSG
jgi:cellulose biosynthesis protein BcsQ